MSSTSPTPLHFPPPSLSNATTASIPATTTPTASNNSNHIMQLTLPTNYTSNYQQSSSRLPYHSTTTTITTHNNNNSNGRKEQEDRCGVYSTAPSASFLFNPKGGRIREGGRDGNSGVGNDFNSKILLSSAMRHPSIATNMMMMNSYDNANINNKLISHLGTGMPSLDQSFSCVSSSSASFPYAESGATLEEDTSQNTTNTTTFNTSKNSIVHTPMIIMSSAGSTRMISPSEIATHARYACVAALLPVMLLSISHLSAQRAAFFYILLLPLTAYPLQAFAYLGGQITNSLCRIALFLGNGAALLMLLIPTTSSYCSITTGNVAWTLSTTTTTTNITTNIDSNSNSNNFNNNNDNIHSLPQPWSCHFGPFLVHVLVSSSLFLGCAQLLFMIHKRNVLRVMACTAAGVIVIALAFAAIFCHPSFARRFFQAAALPFSMLFFEASRVRSSAQSLSSSSSSSY